MDCLYKHYSPISFFSPLLHACLTLRAKEPVVAYSVDDISYSNGMSDELLGWLAITITSLIQFWNFLWNIATRWNFLQRNLVIIITRKLQANESILYPFSQHQPPIQLACNKQQQLCYHPVVWTVGCYLWVVRPLWLLTIQLMLHLLTAVYLA